MHSETVILFCQQIVTISQPEGAGPSPAPWLTGDRIGRSADLQIFGRFLATVRDDVETHLRAFCQADVAGLGKPSHDRPTLRRRFHTALSLWRSSQTSCLEGFECRRWTRSRAIAKRREGTLSGEPCSLCRLCGISPCRSDRAERRGLCARCALEQVERER